MKVEVAFLIGRNSPEHARQTGVIEPVAKRLVVFGSHDLRKEQHEQLVPETGTATKCPEHPVGPVPLQQGLIEDPEDLCE